MFSSSTCSRCITIHPRAKSKQEKIDACYQHACLVYEDNRAINNQSVRERFGIDKNQSAVASRIIADTLDAKKIKLSDESITSKNMQHISHIMLSFICKVNPANA